MVAKQNMPRKSALPYVVLAFVALTIVAVPVYKSGQRTLAASNKVKAAEDFAQPAQSVPPSAQTAPPSPAPNRYPPFKPELARQAPSPVEVAENIYASKATRFSSETVDPAWAVEKEAALLAANSSEAIQELQAQPAQLDIDCKRTMCKFTAEFASSNSAEDWLTMFPMSAGGDEVSYNFKKSDDGTRLTMYAQMRQ